MKNLISIILVFSATSALAQINLPKLPKLPKLTEVFKKSDVSGLKVQWSCPQENYKKIAQLPNASEVTVSVDENGEVSYHPNIFKIKPLSKQFFQGINPIGKRGGTYKVNYDDCLDRFYSSIAKAHAEYKKGCSSGEKLCDYESRFLTQKSKNTVEESRYFRKKDDVTLVPGLLPGSSLIKLTGEEATEALKSFCVEDKVQDPKALFSKSVLEQVRKEAKSSNTQFPGLVCLNKYKKVLTEEVARIKAESCSDDSRNPVCAAIEVNSEVINKDLDQIFTITNQAIAYEQKSLEYRYGKPVDGKIVDEYFQNNFKIPDGNCAYSNYEKVGTHTNVDLSRYDEEISKNLDSIFSQGSADCQKVFLQNYIAAKANLTDQGGELKKFCDLHNNEYCAKIMGQKAIVEKNIERMITTVYGDLGERYFREQVACAENTPNTLEDLLNKVKDSQKAIRCMDTKKGDFVHVSHRMNFNVSTGDYTLKNLGDNKYQAYFHIEFQDNPDSKTSAKELMKRTQNCMADIEPFLKGPAGEKLEIKIVNKENGLDELPLQERPNKTSIGIAASGFRSHSKKYEEDVDCPTIAHEVMHLFGLCDEYEEKWKGDGHNYACRTVPKAVSLMKNQNDMFNIAVDKEYSCDCSGQPCKKIMSSDDEDKKNIYLTKSIFEAVPYKERAEYCTYKNLPSISYAKLSTKKSVVNLTNVEGIDNLDSLQFEGREFDYSSENLINRTSFSCKCEKDDTQCTTFLQSTLNYINSADDYVRSGCPSGSKLVSHGIGDSSRKSKAVYDEKNNSLKLTNKAKVASLLHPAHFERILGGACEEKGKKYLECAKFAYQDGACEVPEHCKEDSSYLGIKQ